VRARVTWIGARKGVQAGAVVAVVVFSMLARSGRLSGDVLNVPIRLDPLLALTGSLAGRGIVVGAWLAAVTLVLTIVFGRVWCGWLCPLGTVLDLSAFRRKRGSGPAVPEGWRKAKYVLLLVMLFAALLGNQTLVFLDPITIFFRTLAAAVWPAFDQLVTAFEDLVGRDLGLDGAVTSLDSVIRPAVLPLEPVSYQDAFLLAALFVGLIALNRVAPRFWCRYLCPLGGLLGLISRVSLFRRQTSGDCNRCQRCVRACPTGTIDPARAYASDPAECTVCMECLEVCRPAATSFRPSLAFPEGRPYDPSRRAFALSLGAAAVGLALFRTDLLSKRQSPFLLRPPGSREANADAVVLTACTRCNACVGACPTGAIQPAFLQAGFQGLGTPVLVPRLGYCDYSCNSCGQICPTQAIPALTLADKRRQVIGKAYIDESRCLVWSDRQPCIVCQEMCPLPDKAIRLEVQEVWNPERGTVRLQFPRVVRDLCVGCGLCEYRCPVSGDAAIRVYIPPLRAPF
jgi:polyferredoxin